ncbi:MAG: class I SAM-dependent methyltransferase [Desulfocapsa sp.]|nr:class I SAM-dependent methyltransferase [Desulfocapsa sp.]MBN4048549.1 class I SAM-dependent methyltransferase [bacterium AH-315-N22]
MKRVLEAELMDAPAQAAVYAGPDLDSAYYLFVWCFKQFFPDLTPETDILDLGCGAAGIPLRLAKLLPACRIDGVDGADHMLEYGRKAVREEELSHRVKLFHGRLPDSLNLPRSHYGAIVSNSFLHHLVDPMVLWNVLELYGEANAAILVVDLIRPSNEEDVQNVIGKYMPDAPPLLRQDMINSLQAAFTMEEVAAQLQAAELTEKLRLKRISPFQFAAYGRLTGCENPLQNMNKLMSIGEFNKEFE